MRIPCGSDKVDATAEDSALKYDVKGFPTLKWFRSEASEYGGGRTHATIVAG